MSKIDDGLQLLKTEISKKMANLTKLISNRPAPPAEPPKPTIINNLWRKNSANNNRRSNKISLENSFKFFDIYKNLK